MDTQTLVEDILYLSLYDRKYLEIPEQDKPVVYPLVCNAFNRFIQREGVNLTASKIYKYSNYAVQNGYAAIDTTLGGTTPGQWNVNSVTFQFAQLNYPLAYKDNESFLNSISLIGVPSYPEIWSWYLPTQTIMVYPIPVVSGVFSTLSRPLMPNISVAAIGNVYTFTPATLDFDFEANFLDFLEYSIARTICVESNAPFTAQKEAELKRLENKLLNNRQPGNILLNKGASELTLKTRPQNNSYPWFYYMSGGGRPNV